MLKGGLKGGFKGALRGGLKGGGLKGGLKGGLSGGGLRGGLKRGLKEGLKGFDPCPPPPPRRDPFAGTPLKGGLRGKGGRKGGLKPLCPKGGGPSSNADCPHYL